MDWAALIFGLMCLGAFAGFLAGFFGIGGGAVLVPGLFYMFGALGFAPDALMHMAVGTSLAIIVPTGLASARAHHQRGHIDFQLLRRIGAGVLIGAIFGSFGAQYLDGAGLSLVFAVAIVGLALIMLANPARFFAFERATAQPFASLAGLVIGGVSSLIGIGGATLSVPYMSIGRVPIHRAIGTAAALGLVISVPASIGFMITGWGADLRPPLSLGYISVPAWVIIIAISTWFAPLGAAAGHKLPVHVLRRVFAVFMVLVAIKMTFEVL